MKLFAAIIEKDIETNLYVGYVFGEALMRAIAEGLAMKMLAVKKFLLYYQNNPKKL